jgi:hypothetical protein
MYLPPGVLSSHFLAQILVLQFPVLPSDLAKVPWNFHFGYQLRACTRNQMQVTELQACLHQLMVLVDCIYLMPCHTTCLLFSMEVRFMAHLQVVLLYLHKQLTLVLLVRLQEYGLV